MKNNHSCFKIETIPILRKHLTYYLKKMIQIVLIIFCPLLLLNQCSDYEKFYRPNLPEKLCSIGIIDADDSIRLISFEKSFQGEYPDDVNDSLRNLSFSISSPAEILFSYYKDSTIKNLLAYRLPNVIAFRSNEKYLLKASAEETPEISAEVTVPGPPSEPKLISVHKEIVTQYQPQECMEMHDAKAAVVNISFVAKNKQDMYYALLFEGSGFSLSSIGNIPYSSFLDFSVRESNCTGFFAILHGLNSYHYKCSEVGEPKMIVVKSPVFAYFIEGRNIPDSSCSIALSAQFDDGYSVYSSLNAIRIKLFSIPETLYKFEKSLYTYSKISDDPFAEPVYLNGNIKDGNGVFAVCRSSELVFKLSPWY